jgi:predicted DNA-binding protein
MMQEKAVAARKSKRKVSAAREYKLRLPPHLSERIEKTAKAAGKPQARIIIEELESIPDLLKKEHFEGLVDHMEQTLSRFSARGHYADITDDLLFAIRVADKANRSGNISELRAAMDRVGLILAEWEQLDRVVKK